MRPRISDPATYRSGTPRIQPPAVARWHTLIHGLATAIHETSELARKFHYPCLKFSSPLPADKAGSEKRGEDFFDLSQRLLRAERILICISYRQFLKSFYPSILRRGPRSQKCELRDVIHSFQPVLRGLAFLLRIRTNSGSLKLSMLLILGKSSYCQELYNSKFD